MNFTNETINISELPKYEEVALQSLHADYWKVILIGNFIFLGILSIIVVSMGITQLIAQQTAGL